MHPGRRNLLVVLLASLVVSPAIKAQTATGGIRGTISDPSRAVIPGAVITVTSKATGISRHVVSDDTGSYFMPNLNPGEYEVKVQLPSFQGQAQDVTILTGATANADFDLRVGTATEIVQVTGNTAQVNLVEYKIDGVVTREQIENLPLNGRSFLQLAMLEPAVAVESVSNPGSFGNNFFRVSMAGAAYGQTRISVDGGSVNDRSTGGAAQNFSQESVQEFQISTFNFDLATSVTAVGSVNVVSRTGGNSFHGSTFFFFRDHNLAAYPGLKRDSQNADPFFARRQSGFTLGGPLKKDRLFWFTNLEHNNQLSVFTVAHTDRVFFPFDHIGESPFRGNLFNVRFDYAVSIKHTAFLRYSLDKNKNFSPSPQGGMESFWLSSRNFANQTVLGVISVLTPRVVNDFRYNWGIYHNNLNAPSAAECTHPVGCLGVGGPRITVSGTGFVVGHHENVPQYRMNRTYQLTDTLSWQKGDHRVRFGGEWEHFVHDGNWARQSAGVITLFGPETVRVQNPTLYNSLPATLRGTTAGTPALADILRLPLNNISVGVGDGSSPAPYSREQARRNDRYRLFIQDTWRAHPRLTLNYGLAWSTEDNLRNYDLTKPEYLRPILGGPAANLNPPPHEYLLFAPALGLVWSLDKRNKTVFRAGSGIYYDSDFGAYRITERRVIGPAGNGLC
ncbi:MAG: carboxypeptidase regulatory-like domain-containing protein [Acidobacteria bacterium]|nr:carboxypeptidase regulatory-like domain-containing protein [Acidobacteriota bacterium]